MSGALAGIVVADFSRILAGPLATMYLGDLGADVIKVERVGSGDDSRSWGPPFVGGDSTYSHSLNRNKRSVELDLTDPEDRRRAARLIQRADIVVENFRPGSMEDFGLGYREMSERNPGLIHAAISGFGSGAGAKLPGYDFLIQAVGGLMSITGEPGRPTKVGIPVVDVITGMHALAGILAALHERDRTGSGQRVEVNLLSSMLAGLINQAAGFLHTGQVPAALGNAHPNIAPYQTLSVRDGEIAVAVGNDRQFARLVSALGRPELAEDRRFRTNRDRVEHRHELIEALEAQSRSWSRTALAGALAEAGVPAGPVNDLADAFSLAESLDLRPTLDLRRADGTKIIQVANPIGLSLTPTTYRRPPPHVGEHNRDIVAWLDEPEMDGDELGRAP